MSQPRLDSFTSSPLNGANFITQLIAKLQSIAATRSGTARPDDALTGGFWIDNTTATGWVLYLYDGVQDIPIMRFNSSTHAYSLVGTSIPTGAAGGTVDAITCAFTPSFALSDEPVVVMVAAGANTVTNPTLNANGLGAKTITKSGGQALRAGDIPGANAIAILRYNSSTTKWELLNPASLPSNIIYTDAVQGSTATKYAIPLSISSSSGTLAFNNATCQLATTTLSENTTVGDPSNKVAGEAGELQVTGASTYTLAFHANWKMADGTSISVTPVASKLTRILWRCNGTYNYIYKIIQEA